MLITASAFIVLMIASFGLPSPNELNGKVSPILVSPYWLIWVYMIITFAELFLSPMGISFVSKVAPPKYKGLMQGGWFAATSIGNLLISLLGVFWGIVPLWIFWMIVAACCTVSASFLIFMIKRLERVTNQ
jgi:POT family proton-dependent oligopeptide transporter